jgi:hypothetical protein
MTKSIIQKNKQKQNINIKIHVGDKGKKKNKKYKSRKPAEKEGTSSYSYAQPYNPVYIQSGYPDNGLNAGALGNNKNMNALLELAIKGINNKPIEYYNNPLKNEYDKGLIQKQEETETVNKPIPFIDDFYRDYDEKDPIETPITLNKELFESDFKQENESLKPVAELKQNDGDDFLIINQIQDDITNALSNVQEEVSEAEKKRLLKNQYQREWRQRKKLERQQQEEEAIKQKQETLKRYNDDLNNELIKETGFSNQKGPKVNKPRKKKTQILDIDSNEDEYY